MCKNTQPHGMQVSYVCMRLIKHLNAGGDEGGEARRTGGRLH